MASFLCQVQTIQRGLGRSAVAAAAYRSGQALTDDRLAMEFDFSNKDGIEHAEIMAPDDAPQAYRDRAALWNAVEAAERRKDAVPAQEVLLALPHELDFEQRRELVRAFVQEHLVAKGMIADVALHRPGKEGDQRNFHAHIMVTTRRVDRAGFAGKNRDWNHASFIPQLRASWSEIQNRHLRHHLGPDAPQVSHLSLAARGVDRAPTVHLGPAATALERRDIASERGELNRDVRARNDKARDLRRDYQATADRVAKTAPEIEVALPKLVVEAEQVLGKMVAQRTAWAAEREALSTPKIPSAGRVERELTAEAATAKARARAHLQQTEERVKKTRSRRLELVAWVRNPARMIWAKHAELNAIGRARKAYRRAEVGLQVRQDWVRSPKGQAFVAARRQPDLEAAAAVVRQRRTLERKIKRMDNRIGLAGRTISDLRLAHELGQRELRVPNQSPDETRFFRDIGRPAREALQRFPSPVQEQALERLRRGQGRSIGRAIIPGR